MSKKSSARWLLFVISLILLVIVVLVLAAFLGWYFLLRPVTVPDVEGESVASAQTLLSKRGLNLTVDSEIYSEDAAKGYIISQDPKAGESVSRNGTVGVTVSKGKKQVEVPDLEGATKSEALSILAKNNLRLGKEESQFSDTAAYYFVIEQSPSAGTLVDEDTEVDLTISKGPEPEAETPLEPEAETPPEPSPAPQSWHQVVVFEGQGGLYPKNTDEFTIKGYPWRITFTAEGDISFFVYPAGKLSPIDSGGRESPGTNTIYLYRPGTFWLKIYCFHKWKIVVEDYY